MAVEYGILSMPSSLSTSTNTFNLGWEFSVNEDFVCGGLRLYYPATANIDVFLWDSSGNKIGDGTIAAVQGEWCELIFDETVSLTAGNTYTVSAYSNVAFYFGKVGDFTFNSKITYICARYGSSKTTRPSTKYVGDVYTIVDIIIGGKQTGYKDSGSALYAVDGIRGNVESSVISWDEEKPEGTTVAVSVSTDGMNFAQVTNGGQLLPAGTYDGVTATIKVELATEDTSATPVMSSLRASLQMAEDRNFLILEMEPLQRFCNAAGPITVAYSGGTLAGAGGPVADFSVQFTATDLHPKNHQHDMEHIGLSVQAAGVLTEVTYSDTAENEHIEISVTAVGVLTHIDDL